MPYRMNLPYRTNCYMEQLPVESILFRVVDKVREIYAAGFSVDIEDVEEDVSRVLESLVSVGMQVGSKVKVQLRVDLIDVSHALDPSSDGVVYVALEFDTLRKDKD